MADKWPMQGYSPKTEVKKKYKNAICEEMWNDEGWMVCNGKKVLGTGNSPFKAWQDAHWKLRKRRQ